MQFTGSRDDGHAPFENNFSGILSGRSRGARLPNFKFVSLAVLEILAFNAHNLQGHLTVTKSRFEKFFRDHAGTFPGSMHAKLDVRIFSHFGAINI